jgi:thioredoxin 1
MLNRRVFLGTLAVASLAPLSAKAAAPLTYTDEAFKAAQKSGKSILIEIHANWCPTCKAQAPIINNLLKTPKFSDLITFRVDFDGQPDVVIALGADTQSTLISFKGDKETGRSVGDTDPTSIEALVAAAI